MLKNKNDVTKNQSIEINIVKKIQKKYWKKQKKEYFCVEKGIGT